MASAGGDDIDAAVKAAAVAFPAWSGLSGHKRAKYLYALARTVHKNSRFLAMLETLDNGKQSPVSLGPHPKPRRAWAYRDC